MKYPITATFIDEITYDITPQNWSEENWIKDLDNMKEVGIDTAVIMRGVFYDKCLYPSNRFKDKKRDYDDFIGLILKEAEKRNINIYIGLYISNLCWNDGDYKGELEENEYYVSEILSRYNHYSSFIGWYIPHEVGHDSYNIIETTRGLLEILKRKSPEKKVVISPFFRGKGINYPEPTFTPEETYEEWDKLFKGFGPGIDYCAFQDGTVAVDELEEYIKAAKKVCNKYGITLWSNVETFKREEGFPPIDFVTLRKKIDVALKHCEKIITFEFSHFLSPQSMYEDARKLNREYKDYYGNQKA